MRFFAYFYLFLFLIAATTAVAQDGPVGIAFVEAPEQSHGMCVADNADRAFDCARQKCAENAIDISDCLRVAWCYPAGWSADIFMQHREGPHWHQYTCGWQSRSDAEAAAKIACEGSMAEFLIECAVVQIWDRDGVRVFGED